MSLVKPGVVLVGSRRNTNDCLSALGIALIADGWEVLSVEIEDGTDNFEDEIKADDAITVVVVSVFDAIHWNAYGDIVITSCDDADLKVVVVDVPDKWTGWDASVNSKVDALLAPQEPEYSWRFPKATVVGAIAAMVRALERFK